MRRRMTVALLGALLLIATLSLAPKSNAQVVPPRSRAYDHTLVEWFKTYVTWNLLGGPDTAGKVRLMPYPAGAYVSGAGTPDDPALLVGHLDTTLKGGTPFVLTIAYFYGESYLPGTPVAVNPDPVLPRSVWNATDFLITMDGKTILDSTREDKFRFYVEPQFFDPPLVYPAPSSYGSTAATFAQGFVFVHRPLSKGVHTMTLESAILIPGGGFYPNLPDGMGVHFKNTWTITVK